MTFEFVLEAIRAGKKAKRKEWSDWVSSESLGFFLFIHDILADDWEIQ